MKYLLILLLLIATTGCDIQLDLAGPQEGQPYTQTPVANLPIALRPRNWLSPNGEGSCTHATMTTALRWQCRPHTADHYAATHSGGETPTSLGGDLDAAGIRYTETVGQNDVTFLEWSIATRRGCGITVMGGRHMVFLCDLTETHAAIIDSNSPTEVIWLERNAFLSEWANSNSWAIAILYSPAPEVP